jgi:hypothetical protein
VHYLKQEKYSGLFERDQMCGRGIYRFGPTSNAFYYLGEVKDNQFHGLGKMVFRDGTQYFGSFNFNVMQSKKAIVKFSKDGDTYKGGVA